MNFVKKNFKRIITIIGVIIITTGISVYSTSLYLANQVEYNKNGQAKVSDALDDLYTRASTYKNLSATTNATADDILSGKTAYNSNGQLITGTLNSTENYTYNVLNKDSSSTATQTLNVQVGDVVMLSIFYNGSTNGNTTVTGANVLNSERVNNSGGVYSTFIMCIEATSNIITLTPSVNASYGYCLIH